MSATATASETVDKPRMSYFGLIRQAASSWVEDNCARLSASLAFYTFLSIAPLLIVTTKIAFIFLDPQKATEQVSGRVADLMGHTGAEALAAMTQNAAKPGSGTIAAIVSFFVLIFSATGVFVELQDSMNIIWEVRPKPNQGIRAFIRNRLLSIAMVMAIAFILLVSLFVSMVLKYLTQPLGGNITILSYALETVSSLAVVTVLFALIFKYLPDAKIEWRNIWIGAIITAILFEVGKHGLTLYFHFASTNSTYGAFGSLAALLIWVYYSAQLVFFGAEFTQVYAAATGHRIIPASNALGRSEQDRIAAGIPHDAVLDAAAAGPRGPLAVQRRRPVRVVIGRRENGSPLRTGAIAGAVGIAAGAALAYLGRESLSDGVLTVCRRRAEKMAVKNLRERIDRLQAQPRHAGPIGAVEINRRLDAISQRLAETTRRTAPPTPKKI